MALVRAKLTGMTDDDLLPFLNKRVFARVRGEQPMLDAGILRREYVGRQFLYRLAPSAPGALQFESSFPQFTAEQIKKVELV